MNTLGHNLILALTAGAVLASAAPAATAAPSAKTKHYVFAHYMVCCPTFGPDSTIADYEREIEEAQSRGIDGFALNCGGWGNGDGSYKSRCTQIYEAARELHTGFKLFISADYCCGNGDAETRDMIESFRNEPNQLKVDGRPVISSFGGESRDPKTGQEKITLVHSLGGFFVPYFYPHTYHEAPDTQDVQQEAADYADLDGYFYFGAVGDGDSISHSNSLLAQTWLPKGKVFMADVSPYYRSFGRLNETHGFQSMAQEWEGAIRDHATWVEITTWNDFSEKTYVSPFGPPNDTIIWDGKNDGFGPVNYAHVAYLDASRYYIDWFKTGIRPKITRDRLFYFYRPEPKAATGKQFSLAETQRGVTEIAGWQTLDDKAFATTFLTRPAMLEITSGDNTQNFALPAGVSHVSMPDALGQPHFRLLRDGKTLIDKVGEQAIADRQGSSRYNYFAGEATASE